MKYCASDERDSAPVAAAAVVADQTMLVAAPVRTYWLAEDVLPAVAFVAAAAVAAGLAQTVFALSEAASVLGWSATVCENVT